MSDKTRPTVTLVVLPEVGASFSDFETGARRDRFVKTVAVPLLLLLKQAASFKEKVDHVVFVLADEESTNDSASSTPTGLAVVQRFRQYTDSGIVSLQWLEEAPSTQMKYEGALLKLYGLAGTARQSRIVFWYPASGELTWETLSVASDEAVRVKTGRSRIGSFPFGTGLSVPVSE